MSSDKLHPIAEFFFIMGLFIIIVQIWVYIQIPWNIVNRYLPNQSWLYTANFAVGISLGLTEIAVSWLINEKLNKTATKIGPGER